MRMLITGGAGFIGTNAAEYFINQGWSVTVLDNFVRPTSRQNTAHLKKLLPRIEIVEDSIINMSCINKLIQKTDVVLHLAAQVAVTDSIKNPRMDFETNAIGSFNILEAARRLDPKMVLIYSSTNKVYGELSHLKIDRKKGIDETTHIDLYSPYGCSKGAADLYFLDYARSFGLKTVVFRQSCIYGPHQYGTEDQGWLAHFVIRILKKQPVTIYGDGKQVRDLLYVEDLVKLYELAIKNINQTKGQVFNVGGGSANAVSLLQAIEMIEKQTKTTTRLKFAPKRLGDQDYFVANNTKAEKLLGWQPKVNIVNGLDKIIRWCRLNKQ